MGQETVKGIFYCNHKQRLKKRVPRRLLSRGDWGCPPENPLGGIGESGSFMGCGECRGKVRSEVIKIIHPGGKGSKAESLFSGRNRPLKSHSTLRYHGLGSG